MEARVRNTKCQQSAGDQHAVGLAQDRQRLVSLIDEVDEGHHVGRGAAEWQERAIGLDRRRVTRSPGDCARLMRDVHADGEPAAWTSRIRRSEEHTSELQSRLHVGCRLLLEKKKVLFLCLHAEITRANAVVRHQGLIDAFELDTAGYENLPVSARSNSISYTVSTPQQRQRHC